MSKGDFTKFIKNVGDAVTKHTPEILTGIGIAGMITTTFLAVKATPKAMALIEAEKRRQNRELIREAEEAGDELCRQVGRLKPMDMVKTAWKPYIPAAVTGVASITCLIGASSVNYRRNAALATAYKLSETALTEYKEKVVETIGEKKEKTVREKVAKERLEKNPVTEKTVIYNTGNGKTRFYEPLTDRYFESDIEKIKAAL